MGNTRDTGYLRNLVIYDGSGTTNTMIADIDLTYNEGILSLT